MVEIFIDGKSFEVEEGITVIKPANKQALRFQDFVIMKNFQ